MTKFTWNKRAVSIITAAAFVGVLSPVSASAFDSTPDEIVTATMDLGNGNNGGGGGGGDTCTGYSSLDVPTNTLPLSYQTMRAKNPGVETWVDSPDTDLNNNGDNNDDLVTDAFDFSELNTQRDYVSDQIQIEFDANNCTGSLDWAELDFERQPAERRSSGGDWSIAEVTTNHGVLAADVQRATGELMLERGLVNGNVSTVRVFDSLWNAEGIDSGQISSNSLSDWGVKYDNLSNLRQPQGTSGVAKVTALVTLFGDEAKGMYRVKFGVNMVIND